MLFEESKLNGALRMLENVRFSKELSHNKYNFFHMLWNKGEDSINITVDDIPLELEKDHIISLTTFHKVEFNLEIDGLIAFSFNKEFYCIYTHDDEVSCNGVIFYGSQDLPIIRLCEKDKKRFATWYQIFDDEFSTEDVIQEEMLRMLLKRFIIMCTRLAKEKLFEKGVTNSNMEIIREFNFLVDINFREKKNVADYADLLNRSPKTLSNLFKKYGEKSPLQVIHERIVLEAKRLLTYTDKQAQEIGYDLGFEDPAHFSRLFKKMTDFSPAKYKSQVINA